MSKNLQHNPEVTQFLDDLHHSFRDVIEPLRTLILDANNGLEENIKWNGPNYSIGGADRITMRIHPPKTIQLIFHRGAKVLDQPKEKIIQDPGGLLTWKGNDRAIATFKNAEDVQQNKPAVSRLVKDWISAAGA